MSERRIAIPQEGLTKDQEIKLINDIYDALPQDTYLKAMLVRFPQYAEQQIRDDFGMNPLETIDTLYKQIAQLERSTRPLEDRIKDLERQLENYKQAAKEWQESHAEAKKQLEEAQRSWKADVDKLQAENIKHRDEIHQLKVQAASDQREIVELKAKLYDYMTREGGAL